MQQRPLEVGAAILDPVDPSLCKMTRRVTRVSTPSPPLVTPEGLALSDSGKTEGLADCLEAQFHRLNDRPKPAALKIFYEPMEACT